MQLPMDVADFALQKGAIADIADYFLAGGGYRGGIAVAELLADLGE